MAAKLASTTIGSLDGPENQLVEDEGIQVVAPVEGHEPEKLEESPNAIAAMTLESPHNSSFSDDHINKSDAMSQPVDPVTTVENGMLSKASESGTTRNPETTDGEIGPLKGSNGSSPTHTVSLTGNEEFRLSEEGLNKPTSTHSAALSDIELHNACQPEGVQIEDSRTAPVTVPSLPSAGTGIKLSGDDPGAVTDAVEINDSPSKSSDPAESGVVCLYQCCPQCLDSLYHLTRKILVHKCTLIGSDLAVEDVHDVLASVSVDLIAAVKKLYSAEDSNDLSNKTFGHAESEVHLDCSNLRTCSPKNRDRVFVAAECVSHSTRQHTAESTDTALNESKLHLKCVFRDGVLVQIDPDKEVSLHCKFETLCLCSFIELIVMRKHPFG